MEPWQSIGAEEMERNMKDEKSIKELCEILNISQSRIEQLIRIERFSQTNPEIFEKVKNRELTISKADALITAIEQEKGLSKYVKIPLNDPHKAARIILSALRNDKTDMEFIKTLGNRLLEIEE